jgi:hypothetical protein
MIVRKPVGIYVFSFLSCLIGSSLLFESFSEFSYSEFKLNIYSILLFTSAVIFLISGVFIFQLKRTGINLLFLLLFINLILSIWGIYWGGSLSFTPSYGKGHLKIIFFLVFSMLPLLISFLYFNNPNIRKIFKKI